MFVMAIQFRNLVLHDATGGQDDNLVRTYTDATTPALAALAGQPATGTWRLRAVDTAAQDQGKLNAWRVLIKPTT
jgi:subtilisin-like proprotein convertase family protein